MREGGYINASTRKLLIMPRQRWRQTDSGRSTGAGQRFGYGISGSVSALHRSPALLGVAGGVVADAGWPQKCNRLVKPMAK